MQLNLVFSWSSMTMTKITKFVMPKLLKIPYNLLCEKCWKSRFFVEGFWPEFYARERFMKYSMSAILNYFEPSLEYFRTFLNRLLNLDKFWEFLTINDTFVKSILIVLTNWYHVEPFEAFIAIIFLSLSQPGFVLF